MAEPGTIILDQALYWLQKRFPGVTFKGPAATINIWGNPQIGAGTQIGAFVEIGDDVVIGERCTIGAYTFIPPKLRIGNDVWIGPRVTFTNDKNPPGPLVETRILNRVVIGAAAVILAGITIQHDTRIGAGAVLVDDTCVVDSHHAHDGRDWYVGNPARPLWMKQNK